MKRLLLAAVGVVLVVLVLRPSRHAEVAVQVSRPALSTVITIKAYAPAAVVGPLIEQVFAEFDRIDTVMSRHLAGSELNRVAVAAVAAPARCSPELAQVLAASLRLAARSGGAFDPTLGALTRLWDFPDAVTPPGAALIEAARARVGYGQVQLDGDLLRVRQPGLSLDLGGVAKGYAVDRAVAILQAGGVPAGLVDAGGNIRYFGVKPDGQAWRTGIQHPRRPGGVLYAEVDDMPLAGVATSGDYQQYFEYQGRRYHHLLDPATGYPATGAISATAWAATAMEADLLSTALFVLGPERGVAWAESLDHVEALILAADGDSCRAWATSGLVGRCRYLNAAE